MSRKTARRKPGAALSVLLTLALLSLALGTWAPRQVRAQSVGIAGVSRAISAAASSFGVTGLDESVSELDGISHSEAILYDYLHMLRIDGASVPTPVYEWSANYSTASGWPLYVSVSQFDPGDAEGAMQSWARNYDDEIRKIYSGLQGTSPTGFTSRSVSVGDTQGTEWAFVLPGNTKDKVLAWRQGPLIIQVSYGEGPSSSGFANILYRELDKLDLEDPETVDDSTSTEEPVAEEALSVSAAPPSFMQLGDTVEIRVGVSGPQAAGAEVTLSGAGVSERATADAQGSATFTVTHADPAATGYAFTVTAAGMSRQIVVPVAAFEVTLEAQQPSGEPYVGVVADGRSTIALDITLDEAAGGTVTVARPVLGELGGDALADDGAVTLAASKATLVYTPPAYLDAASLTERVTLAEGRGTAAAGSQAIRYGSGSPAAAKVPITVTHTTADGIETQVAVDVLVTRAPVMLVHGFTGDKTTWASLQSFLGQRGFDAVINEYYAGNQGIHDQAALLGTNIAEELARYERLGLKGSRVDVVGHSMGGLIAREYTYGLPPHPDDVRKLIMVGTPNHGATYTDKILGNLASEWTRMHMLASEQLYSGSAFIAQINEDEAVGRHLNPDVQYGNIYGVKTDWVVTQSSAWLNGVATHKIAGVRHSTAIPLSGVAITESNEVFGWVEQWLGTDIPRVALRDTKAQIVAGEGGVYISGIDANGRETREDVTAFPRDIAAWEHVGTEAGGRARIRLSVGGLVWGTIDLAPDSLIALGNLTPDSVTVRVRRGSARFRSLERQGGGHFEVVLGETSPGEWTTLHPDAKVIGLDTDFVARVGDNGEAEALVLDGRALFDDGSSPAEETMLELGPAQAGAVGVDDAYASALAADQWWTDGFYRPSLLEVLREWWAMVRAAFTSWDDTGGVA